jgi:ABC-type dipeptide/oligopeptide/nickel transport system permease component
LIRFLAQRLGLALLTLWLLSVVTFLLGASAPGGPAEVVLGQRATAEAVAAFNRERGLDQPLPVQYGRWVWAFARGDLGTSLIRDEAIAETLRDRYPLTARLAGLAALMAVSLGVPFGFVAAVRPGSWLDRVATTTVLAGVSVPAFVVLPLLVMLFSLRLGWFPVTYDGEWWHLLLPAAALATRPAALIARMTRAAFLETLGQDYIRTARAKGLLRHAGRNAFVPVLTVFGTSVGYLLGGSFVVETLFGVPGVGGISVTSISERDYPMIQAVTLLGAALFICVNLAVDLLYGIFDPRLRVAGPEGAGA